MRCDFVGVIVALVEKVCYCESGLKLLPLRQTIAYFPQDVRHMTTSLAPCLPTHTATSHHNYYGLSF